MRILVLGGTGRTGMAFLRQAEDRGHRVTAFVRSPDKLSELGPRMAVRAGDPRSVEQLEAALEGQDVVVSALGPPGLGKSTVLSTAARATVDAMQAKGVQRLLVVSAGLLFDDSPTLGRLLRRTLLRNVANDSEEMEHIVESSGLDWTIVRPPRLTSGPLTGRYTARDDHLPRDSRPSIGREDLATFLLDEVERPGHVHRIVGVSAPAGRTRTLAYWIATVILAVECVVGGVMASLRMQPFLGILGHLGYPPYLMSILGAWYFLAGLALIAPGLPRLKEWAYAGLIFNYTGAVASHLAVGDEAAALIAPIVFALLAVTSWALRPSPRRDLSSPDEDAAPSRIRSMAYWTFTLIAASEMVAGSIWDLLRIEYVRAIFAHLGYPLFLLSILAAWKLPCAVTMLVPRFPRLKEWAYAGAVFNYSGAAASHLFVGDGPSKWAGPLIFAAITLASWALRPPNRRFELGPSPRTRPLAWIVPAGLVVVLLLLSFLTLPKGAPPL